MWRHNEEREEAGEDGESMRGPDSDNTDDESESVGRERPTVSMTTESNTLTQL